MSHVVAAQFVRDNLTWFAVMFTQESLKKALCGLSITPLLQVYIDDFTVLIYGSPQVVPLTLDLHEYLINEERIAIPLMLSP